MALLLQQRYRQMILPNARTFSDVNKAADSYFAQLLAPKQIRRAWAYGRIEFRLWSQKIGFESVLCHLSQYVWENYSLIIHLVMY